MPVVQSSVPRPRVIPSGRQSIKATVEKHHSMPATRLLLCLCLCVTGAAALVARSPVTTRLPAAAVAMRSARVGMQVAEPPVKIPDFAPANPDAAQQTNAKGGKKYKLLLFNDNVNRRESKLTRTSRGLRTVRTGYACPPPA